MHGLLSLSFAALLAAQPAIAGQFVVELDEELAAPPPDVMANHGVSLSETLAPGADSYAVFTAADAESLQDFLEDATILSEKISEVLFVNSPVVGGGEPASASPRPGHQVYVIERPIPGVGFFGLEKKQAISANSNAAVAKLGDIIEWDRSCLTSEGPYSVYRADSPETLREHGALAGAPIGKITRSTSRSTKSASLSPAAGTAPGGSSADEGLLRLDPPTDGLAGAAQIASLQRMAGPSGFRALIKDASLHVARMAAMHAASRQPPCCRTVEQGPFWKT